MKAKVFISCGTMPGDENNAAFAIKEWLEEKGFVAHVAVGTQNLTDVNTGIIDQLRTSDYYLFIDFRRELLPSNNGTQGLYRGSLYTHQELALAYSFGFEKCIFLQQTLMESKGIGQYVLGNPRQFENHPDALAIGQQEVQARQWVPTYSRHLKPTKICPATPYYPIDYAYGPHRRCEGIWHCYIANTRTEDAASDVLVRLNRLSDVAGNNLPLQDRSRLKWSLASGYDRTIFPGDCEAFDAFAFDAGNWTHVYMHSSRDVWPQQPIIDKTGTYILDYQIFSKGFPHLELTIRLGVTGDQSTTSGKIA